MIFRQLFDHESSTYTYLLAERRGGEALLIDPVLERTEQYVKLIDELGLELVLAVAAAVLYRAPPWLTLWVGRIPPGDLLIPLQRMWVRFATAIRYAPSLQRWRDAIGLPVSAG